MKGLIDMNLSPLWVSFLAGEGIDAIDWSAVGQTWAADSEIFCAPRDMDTKALSWEPGMGTSAKCRQSVKLDELTEARLIVPNPTKRVTTRIRLGVRVR